MIPQAISGEIALLVLACGVALVDLWKPGKDRIVTYALTQISLFVVALIQLWLYDQGQTVYAMHRMVVADPMGHLLGVFATLATMATLVHARAYAAGRDMLKGELFTLPMFSLLGIHVMLSANSFLVVYLGLELMSLSLYALVALRRDHAVANEAAMKYFMLGALASGFLLYGLSLMYGATGTLILPDVFAAITSGQVDRAVLVLGTVFTVAGLAFKLGAVPFHMWVPDIYQGAPTSVTLMVGGAPKLAAFAITVRLLVEGMLGLAVDWQQMLIALAVGSLLLGNLAAIAQTNIKRMLAYSTIAQVGFMLLALTPGVTNNNSLSAPNGYSSAMFYIVVDVLTSIGTFGMIMLLSRSGREAELIDDFKGLAKRSPWFALVMSAFMFSLAGIPPTVGFIAKLGVLQSLVATNVAGYVWLAVIAVVLSLLGAFYYLRVVKVMYFDAPKHTDPIGGERDVRWLLSLNGVAIVLLGVMPDGLLQMCKQAVVQMFST